MADLNNSTSLSSSQLAAPFAIPTPEPVHSDDIELRLLYDPFKPETVEVHQLVYEEGKTLGEYVGNLDPELSWMLFHNGSEIIDIDGSRDKVVGKGDSIGLLMLPQGGDGMKSILRIVLMAGAAALAFTGIGFVAAMAINVAVGLVSAFLLTPKPPKMKDQEQEERAYGIDGAKNSSTEGIPYPVVYGKFRVGGNISDLFTVNQGDDQYLYMRTVLNDGEVDWVDEIEVNEQPIKNYQDVEARITLGDLDPGANDWFNRSVVQINKSAKLTTAWIIHETTDQVDRLRYDVMFPQGLVDIDKKKGNYRDAKVTFEVEYRKLDPVTKEPIGGATAPWTPGNIETRETHRYSNGGGGFRGIIGEARRVAIEARVPASMAGSAGGTSGATVKYRPVGSTTWVTLPPPEPAESSSFVYDESGDGSVAGNTNTTPEYGATFEVDDLTSGEYEFEGINGAIIDTIRATPVTGRRSWTVRDNRTRQIRHTFETSDLERGFYETRIRRTTSTSTSQHRLDEVYLTDIGEIDLNPVQLSGVATLSLKIRLSEQLNQIPQVTANVRGCVLQEYDREGNPTVRRWSSNPAWIALDVLMSEARGGLFPETRIDWPMWVEFAEWCEQQGLGYNGVFVTQESLGEALRGIMRVGHAMPVPLGTKTSVAIDRPRDPVMTFGEGNILEGTFEVSYQSMADRANEFEVSYFDKNDGNKQKSIRYVDPKAVTFNEMARQAAVTIKGIDNIEQARAELWRMVYSNRLLLRSVRLEAPLEAISLTLGDVALIDHPMMDWSVSGRLGYGNTTSTLKLDKPVEMEAGETYAVLTHHSALHLLTTPVRSVVGTRVLVDQNTYSLDANKSKVHRLRLAADPTVDYEVVKVERGSPYDTIYLANAPVGIVAGDSVELFETDALIESEVASVATADGVSTVTLVNPLIDAPEDLANFIFGKITTIRRPFVLTGISGEGIEKRSLSFADYDERIYNPAEVDIPVPTKTISDRFVRQVRNLLLDYEHIAEANRKVINVRAHWDASQVLNYGGADIYVSHNGGSFRTAGTAFGSSEYQLQAAAGDDVIIKVVPFNKRGDRAPFGVAASVRATLAVEFSDLDPPINLATSSVAFEVDGKVEVTFDPPALPDGIQDYEVQYKRTTATAWTSLGFFPTGPVEIAGLPTGNYDVRVRANSETSTSVWTAGTFSVVVVPGSLMANWNSSNDRNGDAIPTPTLPATSVEHTLNTDGSANISFEWQWTGDEQTIDGFVVTIDDTPPA